MSVKYLLICTFVLFIAALGPVPGFAYQIAGELKQWHRVTLSFDGPESSETADPNPFLDYRLQVNFVQGDKKYVVPGYFAADGNAAESSAQKGNQWRVHFMPDSTGEWAFQASFRKGKGIAISDEPNAGQAMSFDGETGRFSIEASDKAAPDMRGKGRLDYVGKRYLQLKAFANYIKATDPYKHPISLHTHSDVWQRRYGPLLGFENLDALSFQTRDKLKVIHQQTLKWTQLSEAAQHPWAVFIDEPGMAWQGIEPDSVLPNNQAVMRKYALWGNLMAGGSGVKSFFKNALACPARNVDFRQAFRFYYAFVRNY